MTIWEAKKEQWNNIKSKSFKERFSYFWEYFGIKVIALIAVAAVIVSLVISLITKKDYALTCVFFGAQPTTSSSAFMDTFAQSANIDLSEYDLSVQCHLEIQMNQQVTQEIYTSMETFSAMVAAKSLDCFAGNVDLILYYAYLEYATDLRTVFSADEIALLKPYLHYIDGKLIENQESENAGVADAYVQRPDSTKPELMADPIPVAISLEKATDAFKESYHFGEDAVISICASAPYPEHAITFLQYCLEIE